MSAEDNPYDILQVTFEASETEIKKSYRVLALKYHPDKDPSELAAIMFEKVTHAHRLLTDPVAKASFDTLYKLKRAAELRDQKLNAERRKAKEDLDGREQSAKRSKLDMQDAQKNLEIQIQRIRDDNAKMIFEEQQKLRQYLAQNPAAPVMKPEPEVPISLQIRWIADAGTENGGYSKDTLIRLFSKYGTVDVIMSKKPGRAIVSFIRREDATFAKKHEVGLSANPFTKLSVVDEDTESQSSSTPPPSIKPTIFYVCDCPICYRGHFTAQTQRPIVQPSTNDDDFEQQVLQRMIQAQQRKEAAK